MAKGNVYLGFDLGASSGRAILGFLNDKRLRLHELHRFENSPVKLNRTLYWNFLSLWSDVVRSLELCANSGYRQLDGIGIDTWGVDFGIINTKGALVSNPVHYRDNCTCGIEKFIERKIESWRLYNITGLKPARVTTLSKMIALLKSDSELFNNKNSILHIPDLFRYFLSGHKSSELSSSGSSQIADIRNGKWSREILQIFDLPRSAFAKICETGTISGSLLPEICNQTGLNTCPIIAVAGHDTASAAASVPIVDDDCAFLSCGTWSVFGIIVDRPILSNKACAHGFVNELGFKSILFVKNLMGLYLFENLYRILRNDTGELTYAGMIKQARAAQPFASILNTSSFEFFLSDDPRKSVAEFLKKTQQNARLEPSCLIRLLLESLVFSYKAALLELERLSARKFKRLSFVGGGIRNKLLCQMIADGTGLEVIAGPSEATVTGNIGVQALATGRLMTAQELRELVRNSFELETYRPQCTELWDKNFRRYLQIIQ
jgi:rhamnulokinase